MGFKSRRANTGRVGEVMSLRLDRKRRQGIARVARQRNTTPSEVVRSALDALLEGVQGDTSPYGGWLRVIGKAEDLPLDLSARTGAAFTDALRRRRS
jgi:hypothetical protein